MICPDCRKQKHEKCQGGTWCDCQHRVTEEGVPSDAGERVVASGDQAEDS